MRPPLLSSYSPSQASPHLWLAPENSLTRDEVPLSSPQFWKSDRRPHGRSLPCGPPSICRAIAVCVTHKTWWQETATSCSPRMLRSRPQTGPVSGACVLLMLGVWAQRAPWGWGWVGGSAGSLGVGGLSGLPGGGGGWGAQRASQGWVGGSAGSLGVGGVSAGSLGVGVGGDGTYTLCVLGFLPACGPSRTRLPSRQLRTPKAGRFQPPRCKVRGLLRPSLRGHRASLPAGSMVDEVPARLDPGGHRPPPADVRDQGTGRPVLKPPHPPGCRDSFDPGGLWPGVSGHQASCAMHSTCFAL